MNSINKHIGYLNKASVQMILLDIKSDSIMRLLKSYFYTHIMFLIILTFVTLRR